MIDDKKNHLGARLGWLLLGAGVLLLYGYSIYDFMADASESIWVRLALSGIGLGFLILFIHVLRQRLIARKTDRYRGIRE